MKQILEIPDDVTCAIEGNIINIKKGDITLTRVFPTRMVKVELKDNTVEISSFTETARSRAMLGTFQSHINNMIKGVHEPFVYKLKVCSVHFPMTVKQSGNEIQVQNFLGEKKPKRVKMVKGAKFKIDGADITVSSPDKESAGTLASRLEQSTRLRNKDRRIFQDGIFITSKAGKAI